MTDAGLRSGAFRLNWVAAFVLIALALVAGGYWYYRFEAAGIRQTKYHEIAAIAELKSGQIRQWFEENQADAVRLAQDPFLIRAETRRLQDPGDPVFQADLRERLKLERKKGLDDVLVLGPELNILLAAADESDPVEPATRRAVAAAFDGRKAILSDPYFCSRGKAHIDAVAPVADPNGTVLAVVVLRSNLEEFLYPLVRSWPLPSPSAETLLVKRDGDDAFFLNELRHYAGAALSIRIPLTRTEVPAVQAVLGAQGLFHGKDYRDIDVLADLRPVAGSSWFMVAKVDAEEVLFEARYRAGVIAIFVTTGILLAAAVLAYAYRQRQAWIYRALYRSERARREEQDVFRTTLYSIGDAVITTDREGRAQHLNPVAAGLTGWSEAEARGKPIEEVFRIMNEETRAAVESPAQRVLREGAVVGLANHTLLIARDGAEHPIADSGAPIRDEQGAVIGVVLVFRDQTVERSAQQALRESEEKYRLLVENAGQAIVVEQDGRMVFANPLAVRISGYSAEALFERPYHEFVHADDRQALFDRQARRRQGDPVPVLHRFRILCKDGGIRWADLTAVPIRWNGKPSMLNFMADVTERVQSDLEREKLETQLRQAQKMEAIGTLAGGIAHDFNNILSVIVGNAEILDFTGAVEVPTRGNLKQILGAAQRARLLVRQILAFSRRADQQRLLISLKPVIKETLDFLRASLPATIQLRQVIKPDTGLILADPTQMQQVLMNLCTNAAHAMERDGGVLRIELENVSITAEQARLNPETEPGDYVKLAVSDTGHGIEPRLIPRIFDPYFTTKDPGKGTGLGLSVVHGIVNTLGGTIRVYSEPGSGTTFSILLPRESGFEKTEDRPAETLPRGTERILFVDDEKELGEIGRGMLGWLGYRVDIRTSPHEALEAFRANPDAFDLIVTDMTMPQMTGLNLAKKLMEIRPRLPIILCTGFSDQANEEKALAAGIRAFLFKPLIMQDMAKAVRSALDDSRPPG